jgi:hypothetical protein
MTPTPSAKLIEEFYYALRRENRIAVGKQPSNRPLYTYGLC